METNTQTETMIIGAKEGADLKESLTAFDGSVLEGASRAEIIAMILKARCNVQVIKVNCETVTIGEDGAKIALVRQSLGELGLAELKTHTVSLEGDPTVAYLKENKAWSDDWVVQDLPAQRMAS